MSTKRETWYNAFLEFFTLEPLYDTKGVVLFRTVEQAEPPRTLASLGSPRNTRRTARPLPCCALDADVVAHIVAHTPVSQ